MRKSTSSNQDHWCRGGDKATIHGQEPQRVRGSHESVNMISSEDIRWLTLARRHPLMKLVG